MRTAAAALALLVLVCRATGVEAVGMRGARADTRRLSDEDLNTFLLLSCAAMAVLGVIFYFLFFRETKRQRKQRKLN